MHQAGFSFSGVPGTDMAQSFGEMIFTKKISGIGQTIPTSLGMSTPPTERTIGMQVKIVGIRYNFEVRHFGHETRVIVNRVNKKTT